MAMTSLATISGRSPRSVEVGRADEHDRHAGRLGGLARAGDDLTGGPVAAHGVDRDGEHAQALTSTATRPLYQPHVGHTVCGCLAAPQRGQTLRDGDRQLPGAGATAAGLRLRLLLLGNGHRALRLGLRLLQASGAARPSPTRVCRRRRSACRGASPRAGTRGHSSRRSWSRTAQRSSRSAVSQSHGSAWRSAPQTRAQAGAVVAAQRGVGHAEQDVLADHRRQVELAVARSGTPRGRRVRARGRA